MPNNSNKAKPARKPLFKVTTKMNELYEKRNRALDSDPDARVLPPEKWANAMTRVEFEQYLKRTHAAPKKLTTVRLDADVIEWLKSKGAGHISRVNSILRAVMLAETHQK
jgi:uncharacterized protein (DUF4415 family)